MPGPNATGPLVKTGNEFINLDDISTATFEDGPTPHLSMTMKTGRQHGLRGPRAKVLADFLAGHALDLTAAPPPRASETGPTTTPAEA